MALMFNLFDYTLFGLMLSASAIIGVYFGFYSKQDNVVEYILGGKSMTVFPVAISLIASHVSGITILAVPSDIYAYGASFWLSVFSITIAGIITIYVYLPVFFKLQLLSSFEYLQLRFDRKVEVFGSFLSILSTFFFLPVVIYVPALAFNHATGINTHFITPIVCIICIFYTTLGGLKAVIWTDTLQFIIMVAAMIVVLMLGFNASESIEYVFRKSYEGGRLFLWDMDLDPTNRTSFWTILIGYTTTWISFMSIGQGWVQKYLALPTFKKATNSIFVYTFGMFLVNSISAITGLIIYARYADCDPVLTKQIQKTDQILPYFIMEVAGQIPGLPGLFIAGIFSAALSTLSSGLNTISGLIYEDLMKPFMPKNTTEERASFIIKCIVIIAGIIVTSMVFIIEQLGSILPLSFGLGGMVTGPLFGIFTLGMLVPFANRKGALSGAIAGLCLGGWIVFGAQYHIAQGGQVAQTLPVSIDGCDNFTLTNFTLSVSQTRYIPSWIYRISFYYFSLIGSLTTIIIGIIVSLLTGGRNQMINRDLLSPAIRFMIPKKETTANKVEEHDLNVIQSNIECGKDDISRINTSQ